MPIPESSGFDEAQLAEVAANAAIAPPARRGRSAAATAPTPADPETPAAPPEDPEVTPVLNLDALPPIEAPAPVAPNTVGVPELLAMLQTLQRENEALRTTAVEALTRKAATPAADEAPPVAVKRKLYFIGERFDDQLKCNVPDLRPSPVHGPHHACGRGGEVVVFCGTADDQYPHAWVPETFGQWLIEEDGPRDGYGRIIARRYAWALEG